MEIVTWVLDGALEHRDSEGNDGVITPRRRAAHERGHRHPSLGGRTRARPSPSICCRCGSRPTRSAIRPATSSATSATTSSPTRCSRSRPGAEHVDSAIHINQDDATLWIAPADSGHHRRRFPTRRSCTSSSRAARRRSTARARSHTGDAVRLTEAGAPDAHGDRRRHRSRDLGDGERARDLSRYLTSRDRRRSASTLPPV